MAMERCGLQVSIVRNDLFIEPSGAPALEPHTIFLDHCVLAKHADDPHFKTQTVQLMRRDILQGLLSVMFAHKMCREELSWTSGIEKINSMLDDLSRECTTGQRMTSPLV